MHMTDIVKPKAQKGSSQEPLTSTEMEDKKRKLRSNATLWGRYRRNKLGMISLVVILILLLFAFFPRVFAQSDPFKPDFKLIDAGPMPGHWLGSDQIGRDTWARLVYGSRVSRGVGIASVLLYTIIGILVGSVSGFFGGAVDMIIQRIVDIMMCFPFFLLILTVASALKPSVYNIILIIGLLGWTGMSRLVRAQILSVSAQDFVLAARALGVKKGRILLRHVIPNALTPVLVSAPLGIAGAIMTEAGLSFLGLGVQDPMTSWGAMMTAAMSLPILTTMPWRWLPPAIMLSLTTLATNFAADALRDAFDPHSKNK